ncbi:PREDICTED: vanin-like protein 1 [Habropoda laboriosa]|uniref:vanin-like protein 1 n=1 Tax=Habropoda laboriosa TaxID=597456 RepID=UPI00083D388D|nr:PREDICTED: vanin-like protein 1 [Habropoda laboriosa]
MITMRGKWISLFGFLFTLIHLSCQEADADALSSYYTAAVVEFSPYYNVVNGSYTLEKNTDAYIEYIEKASEQNADIIVFPEYGLTSMNMPSRSRMDPWTTVVPSVLDEYVPCTGNDVNVSPTLQRLSCAARKNRIYVVVNLAEKEYYTQQQGCSSNATRYYNTNVVFDRTGKIIARYRKVNLYMEKRYDPVETPDVVTFDTDFGVTFGTFICFDILFPVPALNLTRMQGITDIAYSTAWFSETPFLTAVQTQSGWSFAEDVNFLGSGYHRLQGGSGGSGIYLGRDGIVNATFSRNSGLLISRVPKKSDSREIQRETPKEGVYVITSKEESKEKGTADWIQLLHDNYTSFESVRLGDNVSFTDTLCHRKFCCDFHLRTNTIVDTSSSSVNYRAVVFNGVRYYGTEAEAGVRLCAVILCSNDSIYSCGLVDQSNVTFTNLTIATTFHDYPQILAMPTVLSPTLIPFQHWTYAERAKGARTHLTLALSKSTNDLVTFGIYVRDFTKDKWHTQPASSSFTMPLPVSSFSSSSSSSSSNRES